MSAKLIAINGPLAGQRFALDDDSISFGREADNILVIPDDSISSMHGVLLRRGDEWRVRDRGSTNGIRVNGRDVQESGLKDGDELELGMVLFKFESAPASLATTLPPPDTAAAPVVTAASASVSAVPPAATDGGRRKARSGPAKARLHESQIDAILHWTRPQASFFFIGVAAVAATVATIWFYLSVVL